MFSLSAVIFYTQVVGLSVAQVGLGMGLAILVGTSAGIPAGRLADRRGPREIVGLAIPFVVRWAERTRPAGMAATA